MSTELLLEAVRAMSLWEVVAVALGIAYLLLAVRENLWCWYAALGSTAIYLYIFWDVGLLMESALQLYYIGMAIFGWWQWRHGSGPGGELSITTWSPARHLFAVTGVVLAATASGLLLDNYTEAALPFVDSFTTWGSILTTWMVARKVLENWLYWLVIDSVCIYLYLDRELYLTALLFMVYLIIVLFGYRKWLRHYRLQSA